MIKAFALQCGLRINYAPMYVVDGHLSSYLSYIEVGTTNKNCQQTWMNTVAAQPASQDFSRSKSKRLPFLILQAGMNAALALD